VFKILFIKAGLKFALWCVSMGMNENYVQIPTDRCVGNRKLLNEICDVLEKNNFETNKNSLEMKGLNILTIRKLKDGEKK